jgi:hypothetical protein
MQIMDDLPGEARVYSLFEPRSYGLPRPVQPDAINYNFFHDLHRFQTPSGVIQHWKQEGYTHVLVYERGLRLITAKTSSEVIVAGRDQLDETLRSLVLLDQTEDQVYSIYVIP